MEPDPIIEVRDRAYKLADTGAFALWRGISDAIILEGGDIFTICRLDGDSYFKFRLHQRIRIAWRKRNA
jgi:hypothetical protein